MPTVSFAEYIRAWRARLNLSRAEAAELLGVTSRSVLSWETGPEPRTARLIERATRDVERERRPS